MRSGKNIWLLLWALALSFSACRERDHQHIDEDTPKGKFAKALGGIFPNTDTTIRHIGSVTQNVRLAYFRNDFCPIWLYDNFVPCEECAKFIGELEEMRWDGMDPEKYHLSLLKERMQRMDTTKHNTLGDALAFDTLMTRCYLAAARDLLLGQVLPRRADSLWFHANDSAWNAPLALKDVKDYYPSLDFYRSEFPTYGLLRAEFEHYTTLAADSALLGAIQGLRLQKSPDSAMYARISEVISREMPWIEAELPDSLHSYQLLVRIYQQYWGLRPTGVADSATIAGLQSPPDTILRKIAANLERLRWMQRDTDSVYIIVNIPLMQLFFRKNGANAMHMRVVVGKPERQTPSLFATMANVVVNPTWGVPPTILKQDVVPGFAKSGKNYLAKKGLKAYDHTGKAIKPSRLNVHNLREFTYRQAAGDDNSLGYVKFNLPNPWDIYLHDTPHRDDFQRRLRALSSGCIRVQQPREMAVYILSQLEGRRFTMEKLDSMITTHVTKFEILKNKIPVHIAYLTAFEDTTGRHIQYINDVYHRDDKLISLLYRK